MKLRSIHAVAALALVGCAGAGSTFYPPNDPVQFAAVVAGWHLDGMTLAQAAAFLEERRYTVRGRFAPANALVRDQRDGFYALRQKTTALFCARDWRIVARIENERLVETRTFVVEGCTAP